MNIGYDGHVLISEYVSRTLKYVRGEYQNDVQFLCSRKVTAKTNRCIICSMFLDWSSTTTIGKVGQLSEVQYQKGRHWTTDCLLIFYILTAAAKPSIPSTYIRNESQLSQPHATQNSNSDTVVLAFHLSQPIPSYQNNNKTALKRQPEANGPVCT